MFSTVDIKSTVFKILIYMEIKFDGKFKQAVTGGVLGALLVLAAGAGILWKERATVYGWLAREYFQNISQQEEQQNENSSESEKIVKETNIFTEESFVIDAVKKTNPAVVSIVLTKDVPKYETYYEEQSPFGDFKDFFGNDMFPNFFFQVPRQRQNGTEKKEVGSGSGFFVSADGLIVTNRHVVEQKDVEYTVFTNDGKKHPAKVIARDSVLDIAMVKVDPPAGGGSFPKLDLGNSDNLQVGQTVIAIGNALGEFRNTVSVGVVSGLARTITASTGLGRSEVLDKVIQTDAAINPGNSGGPLLDLRGRVIGVNVAVAQGSENIGFALPINSVKTAIDSVKSSGKIVRSYLGVRYVAITPELKEKNNLTVDYGVLVQRGEGADELAVIPGGPADKAGIVENDIILEIDGQKIDKDKSLALIIREKKVGDTVTLKILSKGSEKTAQVKLDPAPES